MVKKNNWEADGFEKGISPDVVSEKLLDVNMVLLMQGSNLFGDSVYSYLQLTGRKLKEMLTEMRAGKNFKPSDFGTVLRAGRGQPSQEVRDEMAATYNMIDVPMPAPAPQPAFVQPKFFGEE